MSTKPNVAATVTDRLRSAILRGEIAPQTKLRLEQLSAAFNVSLSPVREALLRLEGENLVVGEAQRGFVVAGTSIENLEEVMALRCLLEPFALARALERGTVEWEERLVGIFHRLTRLEHQEKPIHFLEEWERAHREFHFTMLEPCGMPMLTSFCGTLYDLADRYRRLYLKYYAPQRDVRKEHNEILDRVIARDPKACELLREHVERTTAVITDFMRKAAAEGAPPPADEDAGRIVAALQSSSPTDLRRRKYS
jgi:GntR family carbon starvation induced transcriptional regulator